MWSIISGGKPRLFATQERAAQAANRLGVSEPIEVDSSRPEPSSGPEHSENSPRPASAGLEEASALRVSTQPSEVASEAGASGSHQTAHARGEPPPPLSFKQGESMTAETDKLSSAASSFATFTAKVGRVADKLNDKIIAADKMVDHIDAKADEVGNFHAELTRIMGQFSNMPPS